jgi:hypothetical protein
MGFEPIGQEVDLKMKRPAFHIAIEIREVRVVIDGFKVRLPAKAFGKKAGE